MLQKRSSRLCIKTWMSCHLCISKLNCEINCRTETIYCFFGCFKVMYAWIVSCLVKNLKFPQVIVTNKIWFHETFSNFVFVLKWELSLFRGKPKSFFKHDQYTNPETKYLHLIILIWRCYWVFDSWTKNRLRFYIKQLLFLCFYVYLYGKVKQSLFLYALTL